MNNAEKHLQLINAFAGFCYRTPSWPHFLHDCGYKIEAVEWGFSNVNGDVVKPELILSSNKGHGILLEAKSGSADQGQLNRYGAITIDDVRQRAGFAQITDFDVVIFSFHANATSIEMSLGQASQTFPLLSISESELKKCVNDFKDIDVNTAVNTPVALDIKYLPSKYVPISSDKDFPENKIAIAVIMGITSLLTSDEEHPRISLATFIQEYVIPHNLFDCFPQDEKKQIAERCRALMKKIIKTYYSEYLDTVKKDGADVQPPVYQVLKTPNKAGVENVTKEIKKLLRISDSALVAHGDTSAGHQTNLFDDSSIV